MSGEMFEEGENPLKNRTLFKKFNFRFKGLSQESENAYKQIVEKLGANTFQTAETHDLVSSDYVGNLQGVFYNVRFIRDCVIQEKLLDIEEYRFPSKEITCFMEKCVLKRKNPWFDHTSDTVDRNEGSIEKSPSAPKSPDLSSIVVSSPVSYSKSSLLHRGIKTEVKNTTLNDSINSLCTPAYFKKGQSSPEVFPLEVDVVDPEPLNEKFYSCLAESQKFVSAEQKTSSSGSVVENSPKLVKLNNTRLTLMNLDAKKVLSEVGTDVNSMEVNPRGKISKLSLSLSKKDADKVQMDSREKIPNQQPIPEVEEESNNLSPLLLKPSRWKKLPKLKEPEPSTSGMNEKKAKKKMSSSDDSSDDEYQREPMKKKRLFSLQEDKTTERTGKFMTMKYLSGTRPQCTKKNCEFAIVPHDAHEPRGRNMSRDEHEIMIKYLVKTNQISVCRGNQIYLKMHDDGFMKQRSVATMQNAMRRNIIKNINLFNLPPHIEKRFLNLNSSQR